jgi:radical SAM protein with 4Fe4S-binding SPASM domain
MAAYAREKGVYTATSTNGHYLTPAKARLTVESGISEVIVSLDGTTQETYQAYRVGGRLDKVLEGIRNLVAARTALRSLSPLILIQFLVVRHNEHQIADVQALGRSLGVDGVLLKTAQIYDYAGGSDLIPVQARYSRYSQQEDGSWQIKNPLENQCWKLWQGAEITWDGRVLPCCFDKDAAYEMGRLGERPFRDIWRSEAYDTFRNQLLTSRASIDMCRNCSEGTQIFA